MLRVVFCFQATFERLYVFRHTCRSMFCHVFVRSCDSNSWMWGGGVLLHLQSCRNISYVCQQRLKSSGVLLFCETNMVCLRAGRMAASDYQKKCLRLKHSLHALREGTWKFMQQFEQSTFLHASRSCCDLRSMLWNRHPHPLRVAA